LTAQLPFFPRSAALHLSAVALVPVIWKLMGGCELSVAVPRCLCSAHRQCLNSSFLPVDCDKSIGRSNVMAEAKFSPPAAAELDCEGEAFS